MTDVTEIGRVSRVDKNRFAVLFEDKEYTCSLRGSFFNENSSRPVVGDNVSFIPSEDGSGRIEAILPRKSVLKRADQSGHAIGFVKTMLEQTMVANFDYVFIMTSLNDNYNPNRIARYISLTLEGGGIPVVILTKADLCPDVTPFCKEIEELSPAVRVHAISTYTGAGLEELGKYFKTGVTIVLLGSSGVGKSTLINKLAGRNIMKTAEIREKDSKGRHTTTARQLFVLSNGTVLIDTPGMRELGLIDTDKGINDTFMDIDELVTQCRFGNCSHKNEPGCAVRAAISDGRLTTDRWQLYVKMYKESNKNATMKSIAIQRKRINKSANRKRR